jgi:beta-glucanase (GH16 family)
MNSTLKAFRWILPLLFVGISAVVPSAGAADFFDTLDSHNTSLFEMADGWTNGSPFNCGWRADHVTFSGGIMTLRLDNVGCPGGCSGKPYASGEYRTAANYGYGRIEARFKAAKAAGTVAASLFTYTGPSAGDPWDEIDIEILGKDTTKMQTNYFTDGVGGHESIIDLGFDASTAFHTYAFEWTPSAIRWYVDGNLVLTENGSRGPLPTHPGKIMVNMWPGTGVQGWLGRFSYSGPLYAQYDYIQYTADAGGGPAPTPTAPPVPGGISPTAWYVLTNQASNRCVRSGTANGAPVEQGNCNGTYPLQWQFQPVGEGYFPRRRDRRLRAFQSASQWLVPGGSRRIDVDRRPASAGHL